MDCARAKKEIIRRLAYAMVLVSQGEKLSGDADARV